MSNIRQPAAKVRKTFIEYFVQKQHEFYKSSSVFPINDPSLLFINAGMNQFKPIFLGQVDPSNPLYQLKRATNSQKCIRAGGKHNDLDDVGKDTYHHTFFEMLGNQSFGDYFKHEAIDWAQKLLVDVYGLDPNRIYATYYDGEYGSKNEQKDNNNKFCPPDFESRDIWLKYLPKERVLPFGAKDNFWEMGESGPCGPCSEIHYDVVDFKQPRNVSHLVNQEGCESAEVIEIWNLVFIQFNRRADDFRLETLPQKHVDTGMGFERLTAILQNKLSNYDTDIFHPIFDKIQEITKFPKSYSEINFEIERKDEQDKENIIKNKNLAIAYRVLADHIRTLTVAIGDGVRPDCTGRGYVLRRILRRAVRIGRKNFKTEKPFFYKLVECVVDLMTPAFPDIKSKVSLIRDIVREEELGFLLTLDKGELHLQKLFDRLENVKNKNSKKVIEDCEAFTLYSRYGFPIDLVQIAAAERGYTVDLEGFERYREKDRDLSRRAASNKDKQFLKLKLEPKHIDQLIKANKLPFTDTNPQYFIPNYINKQKKTHAVHASLLKIFVMDELVDAQRFENFVNNEEIKFSTIGLILDQTSFYAEAGGQIYDTGIIYILTDNEEKIAFNVCDTQNFGGYVLHIGTILIDNCIKSLTKLKLEKCENIVFKIGQKVECHVDYERRRNILPNHTFTHVLNHSLREICAPLPNETSSNNQDHQNSLEQKGSRVLPDKLTFDFNSKPLTVKQIEKIELLCKNKIQDGLIVYSQAIPLKQARKIESLRAVFGETYPDPVRVVSIGHPIQPIIEDPENFKWRQYSIELCGGTHLTNTSECEAFAIVSESGIAKGIRRIVCVTGKIASYSILKAEMLRNDIEKAGLIEPGPELSDIINKLDASLNSNNTENIFDILSESNNDAESIAKLEIPVPYLDRLELDKKIGNLRKTFSKQQKAKQKVLETSAMKKVQELIEERKIKLDSDFKSIKNCIVERIDVGNNPKVVHKICQKFRAKFPKTPIMIVSCDSIDDKAIINSCLVVCSLNIQAGNTNTKIPENENFDASIQLNETLNVIGGKGNGNQRIAQGICSNNSDLTQSKIDKFIQFAIDYAERKFI